MKFPDTGRAPDTTGGTEETAAHSAPDSVRDSTTDQLETDTGPPEATCADGAALVDGVAYATVTEAIAVAPDGAEVIVCPGDWAESEIVVLQRDLRVVGSPEARPSIGGKLPGPIFLVENTGVTFEHLRLHEAANGVSGGAILGSDGALVVRDVVFEANRAGGDGGAIAKIGGELLVEDCQFFDNVSAGLGGAISANGTYTEVHNAYFAGNRAEVDGGAIAALGLEARIVGSAFVGNRAREDGGAIAVADVSQGGLLLAITDSELEENEAEVDGGAIYARADGPVVLTVASSSLSGSRAGVDGGGITVQARSSADVTVDGTLVEEHVGAVGGGLVVFTQEDVRVSLVGTRFEDNEGGAQGGGVLLTVGAGFTADVQVRDSAFVGNQASDGGGALALTASPSVSGTLTFDGGSFEENDGGALCAARATGNLWIESLGTDWGTGALDNRTCDLAVEEAPYRFDGAATFTCARDVACG